MFSIIKKNVISYPNHHAVAYYHLQCHVTFSLYPSPFEMIIKDVHFEARLL